MEDIIENENRVSAMRSYVRLGFPIRVKEDPDEPDSETVRYKNLVDETEEQRKYIMNFCVDIYDYLLDTYGDGEDFYSTAMSMELMKWHYEALTQSSTTWAVFSVLFVVFYFVFHLNSIFLAVNATLLIIFSFPITAMINMGILRNTNYMSLHSLAIFIILGVAADDVFVFIDGWR